MLRFIKSKTLTLLSAAAVSAASLGACTIQTTRVDDFDPRGIAVDLEASWEIDGVIADQAACDAAGIDTVSLVFVNGSVESRYAEFSFDCELGSVLVTQALSRGTYSAFWEAADPAGNATQESELITVDADNLEDIARPGVPDFTSTVVTNNDAVLTVGWDTEIDPDEIVGANCAAVEGGDNGVNFIAYALVDDTTNTVVKDYGASTGCADQITIPGTDLEIGTLYRVDIDGGPAFTDNGDPTDDAWYWQGSCFFTAEEGGATASCEAADKRYRAGVNVAWDKVLGPDSFDYTTCADATVAFMSYELSILDDGTDENASAGTVVASADGTDCAERFVFEEPLVTDGVSYTLTLWGHSDANLSLDEWYLEYVGVTATSGIFENSPVAEVDR